MDSKKTNIIWAISLIAISITTVMLVGVNIARIELPDIAVRVLGAIDLVSLSAFAFSTVIRAKNKK